MGELVAEQYRHFIEKNILLLEGVVADPQVSQLLEQIQGLPDDNPFFLGRTDQGAVYGIYLTSDPRPLNKEGRYRYIAVLEKGLHVVEGIWCPHGETSTDIRITPITEEAMIQRTPHVFFQYDTTLKPDVLLTLEVAKRVYADFVNAEFPEGKPQFAFQDMRAPFHHESPLV